MAKNIPKVDTQKTVADSLPLLKSETRISKDGLRVTQTTVCRCQAYGWPHRWLGGTCRYPDAPQKPFKGKGGQHRPGWRRKSRAKVRSRLHMRNGVVMLATGLFADPKYLANYLKSYR